MGCNASKNKVHIVGPAPTAKPNPTTRNKSGKRRSKKSAMGSQESLGGMSATSENRHGSATSKVSKHTLDSGFDDSEYQKVITENSDPNLVNQIEKGFDTPRDLDLGITGKGVSQRLSAKDKDRVESQRILAALHEEGLIQRPVAKTSAGVSFEVIAETPDMFIERRPPPRLAKLETRTKKKKKAMTLDQIENKLAKAEERRKEREQERLERIQEVSYKSETQQAMDTFQQRQEASDQQEKSKQELAAENREKRLRERRDKLKAKQERIEAAKRRKRMVELDMEESSGVGGGQVLGQEDESAFGQSKARITEDTVIQVKPNQYY